MTSRISIIVADDHPLVLQGLESLITPEPDLQIVDVCSDGIMALEAIYKHNPDMALLDVTMPEMGGLDVLNALASAGLKTKVIFLSATMSDAQIHAAVENGAFGVVPKDAAPRSLLDCLRHVSAGGRWFQPEFVDQAMQRERVRRYGAKEITGLLTSREREIVLLVGHGLSNKEIARQLCIADGTVKLHMHRIYHKLGTSRRSDVSAIAACYGDILEAE